MRSSIQNHNFKHNFAVLSPGLKSSLKYVQASLDEPAFLELRPLEGDEQVLYVAWIGQVADNIDGQEQIIYLNQDFCELNGIELGSLIDVEEISRPSPVARVTIQTMNSQDYATLNVNSGMLEEAILGQIRTLQSKVSFKIHVNQHTGVVLLPIIEEGQDNTEDLILIGINSELVILPPPDKVFEDNNNDSNKDSDLNEPLNEFWVLRDPNWVNCNIFGDLDHTFKINPSNSLKDRVNSNEQQSGQQIDSPMIIYSRNSLLLSNSTAGTLKSIFVVESESTPINSLETRNDLYQQSIVMLGEDLKVLDPNNQILSRISDFKVKVKGFKGELQTLRDIFSEEWDKYFEDNQILIIKPGQYWLRKLNLQIEISIKNSQLSTEDGNNESNKDGVLILKTEDKSFLDILSLIEIEEDNQNQDQIGEETDQSSYWKSVYNINTKYSLSQNPLNKQLSNFNSDPEQESLLLQIRSIEPQDTKMYVGDWKESDSNSAHYNSLIIDVNEIASGKKRGDSGSSSISQSFEQIQQRIAHLSFTKENKIIIEVYGVDRLTKDKAALSADELWSCGYITDQISRYFISNISVLESCLRIFKKTVICIECVSRSAEKFGHFSRLNIQNITRIDLSENLEDEISNFVDLYLQNFNFLTQESEDVQRINKFS